MLRKYCLFAIKTSFLLYKYTRVANFRAVLKQEFSSITKHKKQLFISERDKQNRLKRYDSLVYTASHSHVNGL